MIAPRLLFVPVSSAGGVGEYYRCLIIAAAALERWPDAHIRFVVNRAAGYAAQVPYPVDVLDDSPTLAVQPVIKILERERPHVVLFDSAGRHAQYAAARRLGARVVYISSRFKTRWKGFRWRRMRLLDQHWLIQAQALGGGLTFLERLKCRVMHDTRVLLLDTLFAPPRTEYFVAWAQRLNLQERGYILFCSGGGGSFSHINNPAQIYLDAAIRVCTEMKMPCVVVTGPNADRRATAYEGVHVLASLQNAELLALVEKAAFAVINGGSLLPQALALGQACIAAPIAADQNPRIRIAAQIGAVVETKLTAADIADAALKLARDPNRCEALRAGARAAGVENGLDTALAQIEQLLRVSVR